VAGDPADVRRAPENIVIFDIEYPLHGLIDVHEVAGLGVQDTLGLAGAAAGIENEQRFIGVHLFRLAFGGDIRGGHQFVPPEFLAGLHFDFDAESLDADDVLNAGTGSDRGIGAGFALYLFAAAPVAIGSNEQG